MGSVWKPVSEGALPRELLKAWQDASGWEQLTPQETVSYSE